MAIVLYKTKYKGKLLDVISPDKADRIKAALSHIEAASPAQRAYLDNVRGVYKSTARQAENVPEEQINIYDERYH